MQPAKEERTLDVQGGAQGFDTDPQRALNLYPQEIFGGQWSSFSAYVEISRIVNTRKC